MKKVSKANRIELTTLALRLIKFTLKSTTLFIIWNYVLVNIIIGLSLMGIGESMLIIFFIHLLSQPESYQELKLRVKQLFTDEKKN